MIEWFVGVSPGIIFPLFLVTLWYHFRQMEDEKRRIFDSLKDYDFQRPVTNHFRKQEHSPARCKYCGVEQKEGAHCRSCGAPIVNSAKPL